ncbi:hypothetical protein DFH06DRAFT_981617, partial [Mycena polygramma]
YVFSLDSLGRSHSRELRVLSQYLTAEAVRKQGVAGDATRNPLTIKANVSLCLIDRKVLIRS